MRALLDDFAMLEDDDQTGVANRRQAVRDDERGAPMEEPPELGIEVVFRLQRLAGVGRVGELSLLRGRGVVERRQRLIVLLDL